MAEGVVDGSSHERLRLLRLEEGVSFQRLKTWKMNDPDVEAKKDLVLALQCHWPTARSSPDWTIPP
jgi:hypothetical protein